MLFQTLTVALKTVSLRFPLKSKMRLVVQLIQIYRTLITITTTTIFDIIHIIKISMEIVVLLVIMLRVIRIGHTPECVLGVSKSATRFINATKYRVREKTK